MISLSLSQIQLEDLKPLIQLEEKRIGAYEWTRGDGVELSDREKVQIEEITSKLRDRDTALMNEATIWARAIYPFTTIKKDENFIKIGKWRSAHSCRI